VRVFAEKGKNALFIPEKHGTIEENRRWNRRHGGKPYEVSILRSGSEKPAGLLHSVRKTAGGGGNETGA
jgi:hypothetical protein